MGAASPQRKQDPFAVLRAMPSFAKFSERVLKRLEPHVEWVRLEPGERLSKARGDEERYYFVQEGQIGLLNARSLGMEAATRVIDGDWEFLALFSTGDVFSDGTASSIDIDCMAVMKSVLVGLTTQTMQVLCEAQPAWKRQVESRIEAERNNYRRSREPGQRLAQDFFLRRGYSFATTLKVIQLERCIECNACETACESRHGTARLKRKGPTLGRLGFPIACRSCVDHRCFHACGFNAITIKNEAEVYIDPKKCVGCTACQAACPNEVIEMVSTPYQVSDFPNPLPDTDLTGHTNVDGLYLVGEARGEALIKLAINSGQQAIDHIAARGGENEGDVDVIIAGAGPAGLSAALACQQQNLTYQLFDKGHFAQTIMTYPRDKLVMAEPVHVAKLGDLWLQNTTKEELIEKWRQIITDNAIELHSYEPVTNVQHSGNGFEVTTAKGSYTSRFVVLAPGNRGAPRKIGAPGEVEPRVLYVLTEPDEFANKHILVVGGGDSAVEAALSLADVPGTHVTLSYRRDAFGRIKAGNKSRLDEYQAGGKVEVLLKSAVEAIEPEHVVIAIEGEKRQIDNDVVFALLGAEPPTEWFKSLGIDILEPGSPGMQKMADIRGMRAFANKCDHCVGHGDQACITACPTNAIVELPPVGVFTDVGAESPEPFRVTRFAQRERLAPPSPARRAVAWSAVVAACLIAVGVVVESLLEAHWPALSWRGEIEEGRQGFGPGQGLGYVLGWTGTTLMTLTSLYPLNSRRRWLAWLARTRLWLFLHITAGLLGPVFVSCHTGIKLDRWPALAFWLMWFVVFTGALGRYINPWLYAGEGLVGLEHDALQLERLRGARGPGRLIRLRRRVRTELRKLIGWWRPLHWGATALMLAITVAHVIVALTFRAG